MGNEKAIPVPPKWPTQLIHGDILCLGRSVQALETTHKPVRLRISFRYPAAGALNIRGRRDLSTSTGYAAHPATLDDERHIWDLMNHSTMVSDKDAVSLVKDGKTVEVIEVHSASPSPSPSLSSPGDFAARPSFVEQRSMDEFHEAKRKVYKVPHSVLYPDSDDEEDLPRGRCSEERAQSNMTLASSRGSRHATYSPDHVRIVPPTASRVGAHFKENSLRPTPERQEGGATSPTTILSAPHIGRAEPSSASPRAMVHHGDETVAASVESPSDLATFLEMTNGNFLDLPAAISYWCGDEDLDAHSSWKEPDKDRHEGDKAAPRNAVGSDYDHKRDEKDPDQWSSDRPTGSGYDEREGLALKDDHYVQNGSEYHEHDGLSENIGYVDDDGPDSDNGDVAQSASQTVIHSKDVDFDDDDQDLDDDDQDLEPSDFLHSVDYENAGDSDDGGDSEHSSDGEHSMQCTDEKDDESSIDEDSDGGESLSERSAPDSPPHGDVRPSKGSAWQGTHRKPLDDASEPSSPPSSQSDYGRWYSYSTDHEEEKDDHQSFMLTPLIKQEIKDIVAVEVTEMTDDEIDQGDDEAPEVLPIERNSAPKPLFAASTSAARVTEVKPPPEQDDVIADAAESIIGEIESAVT